MSTDGMSGTDLTDNSGDVGDNCPAYSPDGSKIAFSSTRDGNEDIYVMNADGSDVRRLTSRPSIDTHPTWSPDGTKIAFASNRHYVAPYYDWEIYVMNADGSSITDLTNNAVESEDMSPDWSPDGTKIAFTSSRNGGDQNVWVMDADGSDPQRLTGEVAHESGPDWSPDGTKIAFMSSRYVRNHIFVIDADGSNTVQLTDGYYWNDAPSWSPDGSRIAFSSSRDGNSEIYVMNADGSSQTRITNNDDSDSQPCWGPAPDLTVLVPNGGEEWQAGKTHTITWDQAGLYGTDVRIELWKNWPAGTLQRVIAASVPATDEAYRWTIPASVEPSTRYWVNIVSTSFPGVSDDTDGWLIITAAPLKVLPGCTRLPGDPDGDGIYEDLNGNGRLDFADVVLFFNQMGWIAENEPVSAFDLNGNGRIDFADVVALFNEI